MSGRAGAISGGRRTYHAIVAARVRKLFKRLGLWDYPLVLDKLAAQRDHGSYGVPALGGARRMHAAIKRWDERLPRVLPVKEVLGRNAAWGTAEAVAPPILD